MVQYVPTEIPDTFFFFKGQYCTDVLAFKISDHAWYFEKMTLKYFFVQILCTHSVKITCSINNFFGVVLGTKRPSKVEFRLIYQGSFSSSNFLIFCYSSLFGMTIKHFGVHEAFTLVFTSTALLLFVYISVCAFDYALFTDTHWRKRLH